MNLIDAARAKIIENFPNISNDELETRVNIARKLIMETARNEAERMDTASTLQNQRNKTEE